MTERHPCCHHCEPGEDHSNGHADSCPFCEMELARMIETEIGE